MNKFEYPYTPPEELIPKETEQTPKRGISLEQFISTEHAESDPGMKEFLRLIRE